jgi:hypothetical protein
MWPVFSGVERSVAFVGTGTGTPYRYKKQNSRYFLSSSTKKSDKLIFYNCTWRIHKYLKDTVAERLRRSTRNRLGLSRVGSSPAGVDVLQTWITIFTEQSFCSDCRSLLVQHSACWHNKPKFEQKKVPCRHNNSMGIANLKRVLVSIMWAKKF